MVPLAVVLAVGVTGTMLALAASQRTADAYGAYQRRADIGDVVINPSWATREIDSVIRSLPGVEQVTVSALLTISPDDGAPRPRAAVDDPDSIPILGAVFGSPDGGYVDMDRPIVVEGRLPTGPDEMVMTAALAEVVGDLEVGDTTPMAFWEGVLLESAVEGDYEAYLAEEVQPSVSNRSSSWGSSRCRTRFCRTTCTSAVWPSSRPTSLPATPARCSTSRWHR